ncbi:MAG: cation-translocating P-type ATPase [Firmicutes bacterium]|nr:cation-translocating P-type ATPase [Bacillota bacterium]
MTAFHQITAEQALHQTGSSREGLSPAEARRRRERQGPNLLPQPAPPSLARRLLGQLTDPMITVLLLASLVSAGLGEWTDAAIISGVVLANAALSLFQEGRAERATAALARLTAAEARVRRAGAVIVVPGAELVTGDIVLLEAGDVVPADLRLLEVSELSCDESSLSGESLAAEKSAAPCPAAGGGEISLSDRHCLAFMGCPVTRGRGTGVVVACGGDTVMGRMASLLEGENSPPTPLQRRLAELSRVLSRAVCAVCVLVFLLTVLVGGYRPLDGFLLAVSLAVAAVPEGLVVVVTLVLSLGVAAMSRKQALVRRLSAVEGLGAVQVICCDKTGTLTRNRMTVTAWVGPSRLLAEAGALCSHVEYGPDGAPLGEATETALAAFAAAWGVERRQALAELPLVAELPFDSRRKLMSTLHRHGATTRQYTKGAFERVLERCTEQLDEAGRRQPLTAERRRQWQEQAEELAAQGLRVLAAALREGGEQPVEHGLTLIGLYGISDPPREGAAAAIAQARQAGVTTVMISGDNPVTATAIGRQLGLLPERGELPPGAVLTGGELAALGDRELSALLPRVRVFARVTPEDKLRIVGLWQKKGRVVAMTGDGVNDAPALHAADIGVGMGAGGAEVCRRTAALVLADDDFSTIVTAIREGRRIYDNIRRAIRFLLSSNLAEVLTIFVTAALGLRLFLPVHLLWINLITDCLPAVALGLEAAAPDVMRRPPRRREESVFAGGMAGAILRQGCAMAGLTLAAYALGRRGCLGLPGGSAAATAMAFVTLSTSELLQAWNMRSAEASVFTLPTANPALAAAVICSVGLDLLLLYLPPLSRLFALSPLPPRQLLLSLLLAAAIVPGVEAEKLIARRRRARQKR